MYVVGIFSLVQVVDDIKKILYAAEVDASIVEEGQAMLLHQEKPTLDVEEYKTQKRKSIISLDVDVAASDKLSILMLM
ncbi:hypothetical protein Hanom_Chr06g00551871 [Helianthus anomalus]